MMHFNQGEMCNFHNHMESVFHESTVTDIFNSQARLLTDLCKCEVIFPAHGVAKTLDRNLTLQ